MKLGFVRIRQACPSRYDQATLSQQIRLADTLGLHLGYFPKLNPHEIRDCKVSPANRLKIGLDAVAFGPLAPAAMETAIRDLNDYLDDRLYLGVEMCCEGASMKGRVKAQNFETLFSQGPNSAIHIKSRFPMRPPCPKIIGLPLKGSREEASLAAARGYLPFTPSWLDHRAAARHWPAIVEGATSSLRRARPSHWNVARTIVVHDDPTTVETYVFGANSPIRNYYARLAKQGLIDADIDTQLRRVVIAGSASQVLDDLYELREAIGEIGTLLMIDHPGCDVDLTRKTMVQLAEDVLPNLAKATANTTKELERT